MGQHIWVSMSRREDFPYWLKRGSAARRGAPRWGPALGPRAAFAHPTAPRARQRDRRLLSGPSRDGRLPGSVLLNRRHPVIPLVTQQLAHARTMQRIVGTLVPLGICLRGTADSAALPASDDRLHLVHGGPRIPLFIGSVVRRHSESRRQVRARIATSPWPHGNIVPQLTSEPPTLRSTVRPPPGRLNGASRHCVMACGHH